MLKFIDGIKYQVFCDACEEIDYCTELTINNTVGDTYKTYKICPECLELGIDLIKMLRRVPK